MSCGSNDLFRLTCKHALLEHILLIGKEEVPLVQNQRSSEMFLELKVYKKQLTQELIHIKYLGMLSFVYLEK